MITNSALLPINNPALLYCWLKIQIPSLFHKKVGLLIQPRNGRLLIIFWEMEIPDNNNKVILRRTVILRSSQSKIWLNLILLFTLFVSQSTSPPISRVFYSFWQSTKASSYVLLWIDFVDLDLGRPLKSYDWKKESQNATKNEHDIVSFKLLNNLREKRLES